MDVIPKRDIKCRDYYNYNDGNVFGQNYFGYSKGFEDNIRPLIQDSSYSPSYDCTYPDSLISTTPSKEWEVDPEFFIRLDKYLYLDVELDYESTKNKSFELSVRASTNKGSIVFPITLKLKDVDD